MLLLWWVLVSIPLLLPSTLSRVFMAVGLSPVFGVWCHTIVRLFVRFFFSFFFFANEI